MGYCSQEIRWDLGATTQWWPDLVKDLSGDFTFGDIGWNGQFLCTGRDTTSRGFRQFFPVVDGRPAGFRGQANTGNVQVIMPFQSNQDINVDFLYASSSFNGGFGADTGEMR